MIFIQKPLPDTNEEGRYRLKEKHFFLLVSEILPRSGDPDHLDAHTLYDTIKFLTFLYLEFMIFHTNS